MTRNTPKIPSIQTAGTRALIVTLCLSLAGVAMATDVEREQRIVTELEASLFDGDLQRLSAGKVTFPAVELAPDSKPVRGSIMLLHGRGVHANWQRPFPLATLKIPVLDIYGANHDFTAYTGAMAQRISASPDSLTF